MEKQKNLREEVLQDATLQNDLQEMKEALEIQRLKEQIISKILMENNRNQLRIFVDCLFPCRPQKVDDVIPPSQGNG